MRIVAPAAPFSETTETGHRPGIRARCYRWLLIGAGHLPLQMLHALGALLGWLLWVAPSKQRRITLQNLGLCLPRLSDRARRSLARRSLIHSGQALLEAAAIWFGPEQRLRRWLHHPEAERTLRAANASGPVIVLSAHIGAWELAGMFCSANGRITSIYKPQSLYFDALIREGRERLHAKLVPSTGSGVKHLLLALQRAEMIGVLPDHDPPLGSGAFAPLFGISAHTSTLPMRLVQRTQATVWWCYAERLRGSRGFRMHVKPFPIAIGAGEPSVAALNLAVEGVVRHLPEQYWWSYARFRHRPKEEPAAYH